MTFTTEFETNGGSRKKSPTNGPIAYTIAATNSTPASARSSARRRRSAAVGATVAVAVEGCCWRAIARTYAGALTRVNNTLG